MSCVVPLVTLGACLAPEARAQATFTVTVDPAIVKQPVSGRLVLFLVRDDNPLLRGRRPIDGPFFESPSPMFGVDVKDAAPGASITIDDRASSFLFKPSELPPGAYTAQAALLIDRRRSGWQQEAGHLTTARVRFEIKGGNPEAADPALPKAAKVSLSLSERSGAPEEARQAGVEFVEVRSKLLSEFHGREVKLRAGVVLPVGYSGEGDRRYPAVYEVPGFGGDHQGARGVARDRSRFDAKTPGGRLARNAFWIVLDPESPNGHTLFADSANNGPCGRALVEELIPAIEQKYRLESKPEARLLRGHSSGGWSVVWLATRYPKTFGAAWASSPDPVDFRAFQRTDIYASGANMYAEVTGDTPSYRDEQGLVKMTVRQENLMEEVLGPDNTSGQQWDSWQAVFGPRNGRGHPAALYDAATGKVDHDVAMQYSAYDITQGLRAEPGVYGPLLQQRVRIIVGGGDNFYLNLAVERLKEELGKYNFIELPEGKNGYVKIVPGRDHGTIFQTPEIINIWDEMLDHLKRQQLLP